MRCVAYVAPIENKSTVAALFQERMRPLQFSLGIGSELNFNKEMKRKKADINI